MKTKKIFLIFVILFIRAAYASAHPHIFIQNRIEVLVGTEGINGFNIRWEFDEMFSSTIINDYDKNDDGQFDSKELELLEEEMFSNLKNYSYFLHLRSPEKEYSITEVTDFTAKIATSTVIYNFFVPLPIEITKEKEEITIAAYDDTFYVAVEYCDPAVKFTTKENNSFEINYEIVKNKNKPFYYGQFYPEEIIMEFQKKSD